MKEITVLLEIPTIDHGLAIGFKKIKFKDETIKKLEAQAETIVLHTTMAFPLYKNNGEVVNNLVAKMIREILPLGCTIVGIVKPGGWVGEIQPINLGVEEEGL